MIKVVDIVIGTTRNPFNLRVQQLGNRTVKYTPKDLRKTNKSRIGTIVLKKIKVNIGLVPDSMLPEEGLILFERRF